MELGREISEWWSEKYESYGSWIAISLKKKNEKRKDQAPLTQSGMREFLFSADFLVLVFYFSLFLVFSPLFYVQTWENSILPSFSVLVSSFPLFSLVLTHMLAQFCFAGTLYIRRRSQLLRESAKASGVRVHSFWYKHVSTVVLHVNF